MPPFALLFLLNGVGMTFTGDFEVVPRGFGLLRVGTLALIIGDGLRKTLGDGICISIWLVRYLSGDDDDV